jgi:hypothetical protein
LLERDRIENIFDGINHRAFGFDRGAAFLLCAFATDMVAALAFARARAALLAAARRSADHGVY